ncbi:MAG: histidine--tRNA ligase [Candidatus Omnitrophica bacterium]|nr:histidine--tRNA ligase [Candidatus Omnitrophota bacterium]
MSKKYRSIRGTADFDSHQAYAFNRVVEIARQSFKNYSFDEIILPFLEEEGLFVRGVGQNSDIAEKQLFRIQDKDGVVLRPEGTAQVVRYFLENSLFNHGDFFKFSYIGAMFRGERPQKGRLRQFHHLGAEAIGSDNPALDAQIIILALDILDAVGVKEKELLINTLGCDKDKEIFSKELVKKLDSKKNNLCEDCKRRLGKNPLRVIDCKNKECKKTVTSLNIGEGRLCSNCQTHFDEVLGVLDMLKIKYTHAPYLVRGLDYYTNTVFEITSSALGSQDAIGAGGRYNNLIKNLGGPDIPAIGFALGIERILIALGESGEKERLKAYVAVADNSLRGDALKMVNELRGEGISCDTDYCLKSLKGQLRAAVKRRARFVVIFGEEEHKKGCVLLKDMDKSIQSEIKTKDLINEVKNA